MQTLLIIDIEPALLASLLQQFAVQGSVLALHTDAEPPGSAAPPPSTLPLRAVLMRYGLTPRQCDVVLLDLQGYTRDDIAIHCRIKPLSVKKYWTGIYAQLGIPDRQAFREWVLAQYAESEGPLPFELAEDLNDDLPDCSANHPCRRAGVSPAPVTLLETQPYQPVEQ